VVKATGLKTRAVALQRRLVPLPGCVHPVLGQQAL